MISHLARRAQGSFQHYTKIENHPTFFSSATDITRDAAKIAVVAVSAYLGYHAVSTLTQYSFAALGSVPLLSYVTHLTPSFALKIPPLTSSAFASCIVAAKLFGNDFLYRDATLEIDDAIHKLMALLDKNAEIPKKEVSDGESLESIEKLLLELCGVKARALFGYHNIRGEPRVVFDELLAALKSESEKLDHSHFSLNNETKIKVIALISLLHKMKSQRAGYLTKASQKPSNHPLLESFIERLGKFNLALLQSESDKLQKTGSCLLESIEVLNLAPLLILDQRTDEALLKKTLRSFENELQPFLKMSTKVRALSKGQSHILQLQSLMKNLICQLSFSIHDQTKERLQARELVDDQLKITQSLLQESGDETEIEDVILEFLCECKKEEFTEEKQNELLELIELMGIDFEEQLFDKLAPKNVKRKRQWTLKHLRKIPIENIEIAFNQVAKA